jgi:hypothetical protein
VQTRNPNLVVMLLLVALGGGGFALWRLLADPAPREEGAGEPLAVPSPLEPPPGQAPSPEAVVRSAEDLPLRRATGERGTTEEASSSAPETSWRECLAEESREAVRACIEGWLPAEGLLPAQLAALLCDGEGIVDEEERLLLELAAARWTPAEFFVRGAELHALCANLGGIWSEFFLLRAADPAWAAAARDLLDEAWLFDGGESTTFVELALEFAEQGDLRLRAILEQGARGELGGSDRQVALTISEMVRLESDPSERLRLTESILDSPDFSGREYETDALTGALLDRRTVVAATRERALALTRRLLGDVRLGPGAARHLLRLGEWGVLPAVYSDGEITDLERQARAVALLD